MKKFSLLFLIFIGLLIWAKTISHAQTIDLSAGQLPVLVSTNDLKVAELKCPENAVLVIQVKQTYTALVSCPPDFLVAPAATLLSVSMPVQFVSPIWTPESPLVTPEPLTENAVGAGNGAIPVGDMVSSESLMPTVTATPWIMEWER